MVWTEETINAEGMNPETIPAEGFDIETISVEGMGVEVGWTTSSFTSQVSFFEENQWARVLIQYGVNQSVIWNATANSSWLDEI